MPVLYHFGGQVDKLDNSVDFARAYGALGWALSKVIKRKDGLPRQLLYPFGYVSEDSNDCAVTFFPQKFVKVSKSTQKMNMECLTF